MYFAHGLEELILLKYWYHTKKSYRFNAIPVQTSMAVFIELEQIIPKFLWNHTDPQKNQSDLEKEQSWSYQTHRFYTILQICSNPNSMVTGTKTDTWIYGTE